MHQSLHTLVALKHISSGSGPNFERNGGRVERSQRRGRAAAALPVAVRLEDVAREPEGLREEESDLFPAQRAPGDRLPVGEAEAAVRVAAARLRLRACSRGDWDRADGDRDGAIGHLHPGARAGMPKCTFSIYSI